jgi:hypothetical protein
MGDGFAVARLFYKTFEAGIRWDIKADHALLTLTAETDREITSSILITDESHVETDTEYETVSLPGFSPYSEGNKEKMHEAIRFKWRKQLSIKFKP